jgi:cell division septation protein DedD
MHRDNKSGIKGVSWDKYKNMWVAKIQANKKRIQLGYFKNINDAKNAIEKARVELHGTFVNHGTFREVA